MELQRSKDELAGTLFSSDNAQSGNAARLEVSYSNRIIGLNTYNNLLSFFQRLCSLL